MFFRDLLTLLDKNKKLPYYAAERRIDLFINFFLEDILSSYYPQEVIYVASEFPLKQKNNMQADKLDYLCMFKETKQPIFIELKTDTNSFSEKQLENYIDKASNWPNCITNLNKIIGNKGMRFDYRIKYFHLLKCLYDHGIVRFDKSDASTIIEQIKEVSITDITQKKKGWFSRSTIDLVKSMSTTWQGKAKILHLIPTSDSLCSRIMTAADKIVKKLELEVEVMVLQFSDIKSLKVRPKTVYQEEYQQLLEFLASIK